MATNGGNDKPTDNLTKPKASPSLTPHRGVSSFLREIHTGGCHAIGTTQEDASVHKNSLRVA